MHMDPLAARRTQAGAPVVHGVHALLRGLDRLAQAAPEHWFASLTVRFNQLIYVGDTVEFALADGSETGCTLVASVAGTPVFQATLDVAFPCMEASPLPIGATSLGQPQTRPVELDLAGMAGRSGAVALPAADAIAAAFPHLARAWSPARVAAVAATSTLVGMACPGLHSLYGTLSLAACDASAEMLAYRVTDANPRHRMVQMEVEGGGMRGTVLAFARLPPARQPTMEALAGRVPRDAFAGGTALIIGGSRGLGELSAKLLAVGGARTIVTYAAGSDDAAHLAASIRAWGGWCEAVRYDVRQPAAGQLAGLPTPGQLYYFATPPIFQRRTTPFMPERHAAFQAFYVDGFYDAFQALHAASPGLAAFYPSSVAVETRPAGMTEYAMAKAAGEILCADLQANWPGARIVVSRLPRLPTDQTAALTQIDTADPVAVLLPILHEVQSPCR